MSGEKPQNAFPGLDPFMQMWNDFAGRMSAVGMTPPQAGSDAAQQMRRAFFDSLTQYFDQYMRSDAFLNAMRQSMESGLAMQNMINQQLQKGLNAMQMPSRMDTDHVAMLVRGVEDRLLDRIDELHKRIDRLENSPGATANGQSGKRTKA
ncbi:MAG: hypothetical protein JNG88_14480 [Phycisphaerales bacterium]|nr:hypothetical protein [Phycisphaerales bacterium]